MTPFQGVPFQIFTGINNNTRGAAETLNIALRLLTIPDCPIISLDGDNYYKINIIELWNGTNKILTVKDTSNVPIYSYVKVDSNNKLIVDILEKNKVSNYACTGAYGFKPSKI